MLKTWEKAVVQDDIIIDILTALNDLWLMMLPK